MYSTNLVLLLDRSDERLRLAKKIATSARHMLRDAMRKEVVDPLEIYRLLLHVMTDIERVEELTDKAVEDIEIGRDLAGPLNKKRPYDDDIRRRMDRNQ